MRFTPLLGWVLVLILGLFLPTLPSAAQGYVDQMAVAGMLNHNADSLDAVPEATYDYYVLHSSSGNNVYARNTFFNELSLKATGQPNARRGQAFALVVGLLNRVTMHEVNIGDSLAVPSHFDVDFRAYSPFPRQYEGGREFDKLFIMDKSNQAFAAYQHGELIRWGIISTGDPTDSATPNGRFNFNWKEEYRISSESPKDEPWEMYYVFNFVLESGIHVHQYVMPTGGASSHGCVRLIDADAEYIFNWADPWQTTSGGDGFASRLGRLKKQGTTVLVIGTEPEGRPQPFTFTDKGPILKLVDLPAHPYDVPPGAAQQRFFDKLQKSR